MRFRAGVGLVLGLSTLLVGCSLEPSGNHPLVGTQAPLFSATLLDEQPFDLANHLGKSVVVLDFWATWCGPCRQALPTLAEVTARYKDKGVEFFAVDIGETPDEVREFLSGSGLNLTVVMDRDGKISDLYQAQAIPQTVLIGKDGSIQAVHVGVSPDLEGQLTRELDALVAGEPLADADRPTRRTAGLGGAE
jgi:thiol-disulfide isomerase/thioredoxin